MNETAVSIVSEVTDFLNQGVTCVNWLLDSATGIVVTFVTSSGIADIASVCMNPVTPSIVGAFFTSLVAVLVFDFVRGR